MAERKDPQRKNESTTEESEQHFTSVPKLKSCLLVAQHQQHLSHCQPIFH